MRKSIFFQIIEKFFAVVVGKITEKINDKEEQTLLHKSMLTEEYSADLHWGATSINHSIVAADVVALDSELPLKKRGVISNATGELPKIGASMVKNESDIQSINIMMARGTDTATIASKIFADDANLIKGVDYRNEIDFQRALSTGQLLVEDTDMEGVGIRADFGYKAENMLKSTAPWGNTGEKPIDDLTALFDKAQNDNVNLGHAYISKAYLDKLRKSDQGKEFVANYLGIIFTNTSKLATPTRQNMLDALEAEFGATFHIVDGVFPVQKKDGTKDNIRPWEQANIVATINEKVGRLVYGTLAEETNPVEGVAYQKSGFKLVSKYGDVNPLREFTTVQAHCIPVIDGGENIYMLQANQTK